GLIEPSQSIAIGSGPADTPFEDEIFYELTYDLPESIFLEPGHYWLIPQLDGEDVFWDATQTGITGNDLLMNEGPGWISQTGWNAVFFVSGECEDMGVFGNNRNKIELYPNPVTDILHIE